MNSINCYNRTNNKENSALDSWLSDSFYEIASPFANNISKLLNLEDFSRQKSILSDFYENDEKFVVKLETPGVDKKEIKIKYKDSVLSVNYNRKIENEELKFSREINIPNNVLEEKISASLENGILTIELPKAPEAKSKQITIK